MWLLQVTFNPRRARRFASHATASATTTKSRKAKVVALHALQALNGTSSCRALMPRCMRRIWVASRAGTPGSCPQQTRLRASARKVRDQTPGVRMATLVDWNAMQATTTSKAWADRCRACSASGAGTCGLHAAHARSITSVDSVCRRAKNVREGRSRSVCSTISPVIASTDSDSWRARSCKPHGKAHPLGSAWIFIRVYAGTSNKVVCDGKLEQPRPRGRCRITCAPGFVRTQEYRRQPCTSDEGTRDDAWTMLQTSSDFALAYCSP